MAKAAKNEPKKAGPKSSSSVEMGEQKRQKAILELGCELIKELDSQDLTAKWMSAYLAELMTAAQTDPDHQAECKDLILQLWRERRSFPGGDPMERYSTSLAAFEALLKTDRPIFEVWISNKHCNPPMTDWANLARRVRRHGDFLIGEAAKLACAKDGIAEDELLDIADLVEPDDQTRILKMMVLAIRGADGKLGPDEDNDKIIETIAALREAINDFETTYKEHQS